ncbi:MAG: biopolymer transporter ExbD [Bacteroidetes bacterium]|nr:biopolymer transporter ExbD [Bacteroidota bacterium]MBS1687069.1 biopolymer transporter ExbD [Bacteroidota bacterium]
MQFRRNSRMRNHSEMRADSLSDIMFFLMLFFLIVSTMAAPQVIKMKLPKADAGKSITKKKLIQLSVTADGKYFIDKNEVAPEDLEAQLTADLKNINEEVMVIVRADKDTPWQDVVTLVAVSNKLKLNVSLAVEKPTS